MYDVVARARINNIEANSRIHIIIPTYNIICMYVCMYDLVAYALETINNIEARLTTPTTLEQT